MTAADLLALADRWIKAGEPDRSLDALTAIALFEGGGHDDAREDEHARLPTISHGAQPGDYEISAFSGISLRAAPVYFGSFDAAIGAIPAGMKWECNSSEHVPHYAKVWLGGGRGYVDGYNDHARPPAILAAALRARAATLGDDKC